LRPPAQILYTMPNIFELCPKHFSREGEKFSRGASPPLGTGLWEPLCEFRAQSVTFELRITQRQSAFQGLEPHEPT